MVAIHENPLRCRGLKSAAPPIPLRSLHESSPGKQLCAIADRGKAAAVLACTVSQ